jgi:hypothetical protein
VARQTGRPGFKSFRIRIIGGVWVTFAVLITKLFKVLGLVTQTMKGAALKLSQPA